MIQCRARKQPGGVRVIGKAVLGVHLGCPHCTQGRKALTFTLSGLDGGSRMGILVPKKGDMMQEPSINVLGGELQGCSTAPMTGFFRTGCCDTGPMDRGLHTVCALMTAEFLALSKYLGNDLSTPRPDFGFAGLKPGDRWCLCAGRFLQAHDEGAAPRVRLAATHIRTLDVVPLEVLQMYAAD